jgi:hypothetical protein
MIVYENLIEIALAPDIGGLRVWFDRSIDGPTRQADRAIIWSAYQYWSQTIHNRSSVYSGSSDDGEMDTARWFLNRLELVHQRKVNAIQVGSALIYPEWP